MGNRTARSWSGVLAAAAATALVALASVAAQGPALARATAHKPAVARATPSKTAVAQATAGKPAPATVLDGVYTQAQADRGGDVYGAECAGCHEGADVDGPPLTGAPFLDRWREDSLESLFEFIKTGMPQTKPGSLSEAAYLDILAHLLHENEFPTGSRELTRETVAATLLVGPQGPQPLPTGALVRVVGCLTQNAAREWEIARAGEPVRARVGNAISPEETAAAASAALGTQTFTLQNLGEGGTALPGSAGQKVMVKGALTQRAAGRRIHVTAAQRIAETCN